MQLPLIKDGVVVNIIEIDESTQIVDKAAFSEAVAKRAAAYEIALSSWEQAISQHREAIVQAESQLSLVTKIASDIKAKARTEKGNSENTLDRILVADAEVEAWTEKVADMKRQPMPQKPNQDGLNCWICPEGYVVGPAGGQIGNRWDGNQYTTDEKALV